MTSHEAAESASPLIIRLFGAFEVVREGESLPPLRTRKGQWLLTLLTLQNGREIEREWLAGTLWPGSPERQAAYNLRRCLSDLRGALGAQASRLHASPLHTLRLDLTGAEADVVLFDAAISRRDDASLERAIALYRGPLLEGCLEAWAFQERAAREQAYLTALERLAAGARARGDGAGAARFLQRAVAVEPLRETAQQALMETLAAAGDTAAAILAYREFRLLLHRELNAEPSAETQAMFERLRLEVRRGGARGGPGSPLAPPRSCLREPVAHARPSSEREPAAATRGNLPQPLSAFVGRGREVPEIGACLASARLVTLTGPGGIGKTRLAIRAAEECAGEYADGAWFVDLGALAAPHPAAVGTGPPRGPVELVPQAVARALRVREAPGSPMMETLREWLGVRQLLLVLDNCEHLIDSCAHLADALLSACPHLRILATSRQALGLTGEIAWPVLPLSVPGVQAFGRSGVQEVGMLSSERPNAPGARPQDPLRGYPLSAAPPKRGSPAPEHLMEYEAIRLLVERASGFTLDESSAAATVQVCRRLDGIPLAIELAAARLKVLSIEQIAARLDDRFRLLTGGSRAALPRQQTLRATMDWSYDLLSEPEQILLRRLSVFAGGFTLEAAEAVCSGIQAFERSGVQVRRSVLPARPNAQDRVPAKRVDFAAPCASLPPQEGPPERPDDVLDLLSQLVDRSLVGVERREGAARYGLLETTREYARDRLREAGEEEEWRARHAQFFLALAEQAAPELRGAAQAEWLQRLEEEHDNFRAALHWCLKAVGSGEWAVEMGLRLGGALGIFWWTRGYLSEGREWLQALLARSGCEIGSPEAGRGVRVTRPAGNDPERCPPPVRLAQVKVLNEAGILADDQGDIEAARPLFQESLALSRELEDRPGAAAALNHLGGLARQAHDYPAARALYEESLAIWREIGDPWWTAAALTNLGRLVALQGEYNNARSLVESALTIQRQLQDRRAIARSLATLGTAARRVSDNEAAHRLFEESLSIARELGAPGVIEETLGTLGNIARARGDHDAARGFHEERLAIAREIGSAGGIAESLYYLGRLASDRGERNRAATLWSESLATSQRLGDRQGIVECLEGLASLAVQSAQRKPGRQDRGGSGQTEGGPGSAQWAARLFGAAASMRELAGTPLTAQSPADHEQSVAAARAMLDPAAFAAAWAEGQAMPLDEAIAEALRAAGEGLAKGEQE